MVEQFVIKKSMRTILLVAFGFALISSKCNNSMKPTSINKENNDRQQKVIERDAHEHIIKTYDGFIYRVFDTLGRQIEWYGNYKNDEGNSNIHKFVEYTDSVITAREYVLEDNNIECKIRNPWDCGFTKYYYKNGVLYKREDYMKIISNKNEVTGHKLIYTENAPKLNPYLFSLPDYLK
jgi:hypothetical protein